MKTKAIFSIGNSAIIRVAAVLLLALASPTYALSFDDDDDFSEPSEPPLEAGAEAQRIEALPMPPTLFEIEEDLKEAKLQKKTTERRSKTASTRLEEFQKTAQSIAAAPETLKKMKDAIIAFRKEIDAQIAANKTDLTKLKAVVANFKPFVDGDGLSRSWQSRSLEDRAAPGDKEIVRFALSLGPKMLDVREPISDSELLARLKEYRPRFPSDEAISQIPQALQRAFENARSYLAESQKSAATLATAWGKRSSVLSEQLRKLQSGTVNSVVASLPYLMGILALFGVAAIFLVRFFPQAVQVEWVVSGQVIQLLTVVTLLLIVLCLALTSIIKEETIGTLLGGIGGYVLSQGIGRAAGRAAARAAAPNS